MGGATIQLAPCPSTHARTHTRTHGRSGVWRAAYTRRQAHFVGPCSSVNPHPGAAPGGASNPLGDSQSSSGIVEVSNGQTIGF
jgi:hypothetical protein